MLKCKTLADTPAQGKRRVFFTSHPDDFEKYFESITSQILKINNCAIYYKTDNVYENIDADLTDINLFVVPITTKLFLEPCRAMEIDVPYALNKPIPILPLMQEDGLDKLFTEHFKDLQYLSPNSKDETAITYNEKLKKYLTSTLVSDELAEKIRSAFDAYIFLSYRKKDRKYANILMRLIHNHNFCRDIAIWYDEYLVPGEDFNNSIKNALDKSDLFTMVVTPNLINEKNYVQTNEYPAALHHKKVLPVEMIPTDRIELMQQYPEIPDSVDGQNNIELSNALKNSLTQIVKRENDNDPQHNYLIGLAYLEGIDVEVNYDRALTLIKSAAEAKENIIPEAIEKLSTMYTIGQGVERDYQEATEWQNKLVNYWEDEYKRNPNAENFEKLILGLEKLGNLLFLTQNVEGALNIYNKGIEYCNELKIYREEDKKIIVILQSFYVKLSEIRRIQGDFKQANSFLLKSNSLSKLIEPNTFIELGRILSMKGEEEAAEKLFSKGISAFELVLDNLWNEKIDSFLSEEVRNNLLVVLLHNLSTSYDLLGSIYEKHIGDYKSASECYQHSLSYGLRLIEITQTPISRCNLAYTYEALGSFNMYLFNWKDSEIYFKKALDLRQNLANETKLIRDKGNLSICYNYLGNIRKSQSDFEGAEFFFEKGLSINEQLREENWNNETQHLMFDSYFNLGRLYMTKHNYDRAEQFLRWAIVIGELLTENEIDNIEILNDLIVAYNSLGEYLIQQGDLNGAEKIYTKILSIFEKQSLDNVTNRMNKVEIYHNLGNLYSKKSDISMAEAFYRKGITLGEELLDITNNNNPHAIFFTTCCYYGLAFIREPIDYTLLEIAHQLLTPIVFQYPQMPKFSELNECIKQILEDLDKEEIT